MASGNKLKLEWGETSRYFKRHNEIEKATCMFCNKLLSYSCSSTTNLKKHLLCKHQKDVESLRSGKSPQELKLSKISGRRTVLTAARPGRKKSSQVWKYFDRSSPDSVTANCNTCKLSIRCDAGTINIKAHLRRKHPSLYMQYLTAENRVTPVVSKNQPESKISPQSKSNYKRYVMREKVLSYFTRDLNAGEATCVLCNETFENTATNMRVHLQNCHPQEYKPKRTKDSDESTNAYKIQVYSDDCKAEMIYPESADDSCIDDNYDDSSMNAEHDAATKWLVNGSDSKLLDYPEATSTFSRTAQLNSAGALGSSKKARLIVKNNIFKNKFDYAFLNLFVKDLHLLNIVEDTGFREFVKTLNPTYDLPTKNVLAENMIPDLYAKCMEDVQTLLDGEAKSVCVTADTWTSHDDVFYLALTGHFFTNALELKTVFLECPLFCGNPTDVNLSDEIRSVLSNTKLTNKVTLTVSSEDITSAFVIHNNFTHIECFASALNAIVSNAFNLFPLAFETINAIIIYFNKILPLSTKTNLDPVQTMSTQWIFKFRMVRAFLELRDQISSITTHSEDFPDITDEEWEMCSQLNSIIKPFEEVAMILSKEKYLPGSMVIVLARTLFTICSKMKKKAYLESINAVVDKLTSGLEDKFSKVEDNETLAICTFLDPRFKLHYFSNRSAAENVREIVRQIIVSRIDECDTSQEEAEPAVKEVQELSIWDQMDSIVETANPRVESTSKADKEIEMYLKFDLLARQGCPMEWWKEHGRYLPNMVKIYQEKCNAMATSLPCDMIFTDTGRIMMNRRSQLPVKSAQQLIFLNTNIAHHL